MDAAPAVVKLRTPADVVRALPYAVGFIPRESLVVVCLRGPRRRSGLTMRIDLPPPEFEASLADEMAERVAHAKASAALVVCYTEAADSNDTLPRRALVGGLVERLGVGGIEVVEALLLRGDRWWSYVCEDACCPREGTVLPAEPGPAATRLAAEAALRGVAVLPDRAALVRSIRPAGGARTRADLEQAYERAAADLVAAYRERGATAVRRETVGMLRDLVDRQATGAGDLSEQEAARIVLGLRDKRARDQAATLLLEPAVETLLAVLVELARRALPPDAAPICTVAAWVAYASGNGALANVALERALTCEPDYVMAQLLDDLLHSQRPPSEVRALTRRVRRDHRRGAGTEADPRRRRRRRRS